MCNNVKINMSRLDATLYSTISDGAQLSLSPHAFTREHLSLSITCDPRVMQPRARSAYAYRSIPSERSCAAIKSATLPAHVTRATAARALDNTSDKSLR